MSERDYFICCMIVVSLKLWLKSIWTIKFGAIWAFDNTCETHAKLVYLIHRRLNNIRNINLFLITRIFYGFKLLHSLVMNISSIYFINKVYLDQGTYSKYIHKRTPVPCSDSTPYSSPISYKKVKIFPISYIRCGGHQGVCSSPKQQFTCALFSTACQQQRTSTMISRPLHQQAIA